LNGHSDVIAGTLAFARKDSYWERTVRLRSMLGGILGPFEASMLLRGLRTLHVRVRQQCRSAAAIAQHFAADPRVTAVLYPGLPSHPDHAVAARQMHGGFGGMLSLRASDAASAIAVAARVEVWKRATSLGGVESLIEHRASVEGADSPCPADLLRLSVGLEDVADLIGDLDHALGKP
jgi:cystathionine gamma-synthase